MWITLLTTPALATPLGCDLTTTKEDFDFTLLRAEQAIGMLDPEELGESTDKARAMVQCIEVELSPTDVARLYRLSGIARYVNDDLVEAVRYFGVARALDPNAEIDPALGKPLRQTYDAVPPASGETMPLPKPEEGWLDIDGTKADQAPADRSYFLQWVRDDGIVHGTWMADKGQVPPFPVRGGGTASNAHAGSGHGKAGKVLLISGLATGVVGGGSMIGAAVLKGEYLNSTVLTKQQPTRYWANQALGFGGIGLGVVGAGLTGVSLAVGF